MANNAFEWLEYAEKDLGVAKHLFETFRPMPIEIICFHCQQAGEKALKATILSKGISDEAPKTHDLAFLLAQLEGCLKIDERYYDYAETLTPYGVAVRYPSETGMEERHVQAALSYADAILEWAKDIVSRTDS